MPLPDPTSFDGDPFFVDQDADNNNRRKPRTNAATGASAAGVRALSAQALTFYFRAPAKAFFRTRVDYMAFAKAIHPRVGEGGWSWHTTTPGLVTHAVRTYGWRFIPDQILPPLLANIGVCALLYTSYLQVLGSLHEPSFQAQKRVFPPPDPSLTFTAGFAAGTVQSVVAAPLDALQVRFKTSDMLEGKYTSMWQYGQHKLQDIGVRGIFAGWSLSFLRDGIGYGLFFSFFEYMKGQAYYSFVARYYGALQPHLIEKMSSTPGVAAKSRGVPTIRPHYALEPCFLMLAGVMASLAQQAVQHPLSVLQNIHYGRLESLDHQARLDHTGRQMMRHYYHAYQETFRQSEKLAARAGGWRSLLFSRFMVNTVRQVPSTSAGLLIFELVRRKYGSQTEEIRIQKDGAAVVSPVITANISSSTPPKLSSSIPLRSLSPSNSRQSTEQSSSLLESAADIQGTRRPSSSSSSSAASDFSVWTDTGDLAEQLADEEDPLQTRLHRSFDETHGPARSKSRSRKSKRVHYEDSDDAAHGGLEKEIDIPVLGPRQIPRSERILAAIMSPRNQGNAKTHGFVGKPLLYFTSVFVSLGVFLFGYDQGVMSGIITGPYFKDYFDQPTRAEIGTMVAILEVGAFIASLLVGRIGDVIGRRKTILWGSVVFFIGGAFQTFATGIPLMLVGRIIAGLGVGALSTIVPVYQSEISPPHNRGKLACIEFTGNICGYAASVWVDYVCSYIESDYSWRLPLLCQCIMGALLGAGSLIICESPRWLLDNDHDEEGLVVIANLYGEGDVHNNKARQEYREIKRGVFMQRQEGERSYMDMFRRYGKRVFIAMSAQALAQLNGINVISYYAPLVFESAGWRGRDAILMTGVNSLTYLASTIPPWYLVDRWGRRPILLNGAVAMIISLSLISYFIYIDIPSTPTLTVIFVMVYNAAFGASWGPIPWLYPPEILPLSIRAKGASLSTASNWAFNWLVGELTPILQEVIKWRLYLVHAFFCACSFVIVYFLYPETSGVRLEDMNELFGDATSTMPTPATQTERGSLMGVGSPVPSLDIRRAQQGHPAGDSSIPGLDIDPPTLKPDLDEEGGHRGEGIGGWISSMVNRGKSPQKKGGDGRYRRLDQEEEEE
ncbi:hypothetical protein FQN54_005806 [Arachnomyces sp. PD_36]|nr:hypothetical protein FQN54_005806 [Arachnomyces sp. PD_36]